MLHLWFFSGIDGQDPDLPVRVMFREIFA